MVGCGEPKGNTDISAEQRALQLMWNLSQAIDDLAPSATARASASAAGEANVAPISVERTGGMPIASSREGRQGRATYAIYGTASNYDVGIFSATNGGSSDRVATTFLYWEGQGSDAGQCFLGWRSKAGMWIVFGDCGDNEAYVCHLDPNATVQCTFGEANEFGRWCDVSLPLIECKDPGYTARHRSGSSGSYDDGYYSSGGYIEWYEEGPVDDGDAVEESDGEESASEDSEPEEADDDSWSEPDEDDDNSDDDDDG